MKNTIIVFGIILVLSACSIKPEVMVTRHDLKKHKIYSRFIIKESPEQILDMLNKYGEVILKAKRNVRHKDYFVHVKLLATSHGLEVVAYDR